MENISKDLKKIYLKRVYEMPNHAGQGTDRNVRNMRIRLQDEFDAVWIKYNKGKATYQEWDKALTKWLKSELV